MCANSSSDLPPAAAAVAARLAAAKSLVVATHDRPDGDAIGSILALARSARLAGKTVQAALADPVPRRYAFLASGETLLDAAGFARAAAGADCVVICDTCTMDQLRGLGQAVAASRERLVVIDHHRTFEEIAAVRWSDPSAAAVGVMVAELLEALGWPLDVAVAQAVMAAVCADTGWMQYANTDARALRCIARCAEAGVAVDALYRTLCQNDRPQRLALLGRMLTGMQFHADGRVALMMLTRGDFAETGAGYDETENLINEALRIAGVWAAALLVEQESDIRGSLRSKAHVGAAGQEGPDVAAVAESLGGGGHARAAGFRMTCPLEQARAATLAALLKALG